eukprot:UN07741
MMFKMLDVSCNDNNDSVSNSNNNNNTNNNDVIKDLAMVSQILDALYTADLEVAYSSQAHYNTAGEHDGIKPVDLIGLL